MFQVGDRVRVKKEQPGHIGVYRISEAKYPGRTGTIIRENIFGRNDGFGGLWYVALDATKRAKARVEIFYGCYLEMIRPPGEAFSANFKVKLLGPNE